MKKRLLSLLLVMTTLFTLIPTSTVKVKAKTTYEMTEAEAFAAGMDVYIAWYNHCYQRYDWIEHFYKDKNSPFNQLYSQIYPDGATSENGKKILSKAQRYIEDAYDGIDQYEQAESEIVMSLLLACMLYTGQSENSDNNDVKEILEVAAEILDNAPIEEVLEKALESSKELSEKFLDDIAGIGDFSFGIITSAITGGLKAESDRKEAIATAAMYDTIKNAACADIDILRRNEKKGGLFGNYLKAYTEAYDDLWEKGSSSFEEQLIERNVNLNDMFIDMAIASLEAGVGAVAANSTVFAGVAAVVVSPVLLGFEIFNIFEGVWKLSGDLLFGQEAMKMADLTLFYLDELRTLFYLDYKNVYNDFISEPTVENARLLNTYTRFMYRLFAASEMYASQLNHTYATAGALNAEWMHYIPGKIDPALTSEAKKQSENRMQLRSLYLSGACDAYLEYFNNSAYDIFFNMNGGIYLAAEQLGFGPDEIVLCKMDSIDISIPKGIPVREGYTFIGWTSDPNGTSADARYAPGSTYSENSDLALYAVWKRVETITYNATGGSGAPASHENTAGATLLSTKEPTKNGYSFLGWGETADQNDNEILYAAGASYPKDGNVTLYAHWKAGAFNIEFHANEGIFLNEGGDKITLPKTYLQPFTISLEKPVREGYAFSGEWSTSVDGKSGISYQHGSTYNDIGGAGLSTKILYAQWTKTHAEFRYDYSNCYDVNDIAVALNDGVLSVELVDPPKDILDKFAAMGKKFIKWMYLKPDGSCVYYNSGDTLTVTDPGEPRECVYAVWSDPGEETMLSVTSDKGSYQPGETVSLFVTAYNSGYFTVDASANTGFKVTGANGSNASSGIFVEKSSASTANAWKCYDNGSAYTVKISIPRTCDDGLYEVEVRASNGAYNISGTETSTASETVTIKVDTDETLNGTYAVYYDLNGGTGNVPDETRFNKGDAVLLADDGTSKYPNFWREGYDFKGWCEDKGGDDTLYLGGDYKKFKENVTLYAQWEVNPNYGKLSLRVYPEAESWLTSEYSVYAYRPYTSFFLEVLTDYSDHFFVDLRECDGFTLIDSAGNTADCGTWFEEDSDSLSNDGTKDTYTNGEIKRIKMLIPADCPEGIYTVSVRSADSQMDENFQSYGNIVTQYIDFYVREDDTVDGIQLDYSKMSLHVGDEKSLTATLLPNIFKKKGYSSIYQNIEWTVSDSSVVSIDEYRGEADITAKERGTATITASIDGVSASCMVTVENCDYSEKIIDPDYLASSATCSSQATYYYVCECGNVSNKTYKYGELAEHSFSEWSTAVKPTETVAGIEQRTCSVCQYSEQRAVPALGGHKEHSAGTEWCSNETEHWKVCSYPSCSVTMDTETHTFGDLVTDIPASRIDTGVGHRKCSVCGYEKTEIIPQTDEWVLELSDTGSWLQLNVYAPIKPEECVVIVAQYNEGQMTASKMFRLGTDSFISTQWSMAVAFDGFGDEYRAFLLDKNYAPLYAPCVERD